MAFPPSAIKWIAAESSYAYHRCRCASTCIRRIHHPFSESYIRLHGMSNLGRRVHVLLVLLSGNGCHSLIVVVSRRSKMNCDIYKKNTGMPHGHTNRQAKRSLEQESKATRPALPAWNGRIPIWQLPFFTLLFSFIVSHSGRLSFPGINREIRLTLATSQGSS